MRLRDMLAAAVRPWVRIDASHGRTEIEVKHRAAGGLTTVFYRGRDSSGLSVRGFRHDDSRGCWMVGAWHRLAIRWSSSYVHAVVSGDNEFTGSHVAVCSGGSDPILAYGDPTVWRVGDLSVRYVSSDVARKGYDEYISKRREEQAANDSKAAA